MNLAVPEAVSALSSAFQEGPRSSPSCFAEREVPALDLSRRGCATAGLEARAKRWGPA